MIAKLTVRKVKKQTLKTQQQQRMGEESELLTEVFFCVQESRMSQKLIWIFPNLKIKTDLPLGEPRLHERLYSDPEIEKESKSILPHLSLFY